MTDRDGDLVEIVEPDGATTTDVGTDAIVGEQCAPIDCGTDSCACARRKVYCETNGCYYGEKVGECSNDSTCIRKCCEACANC